MSSLVRGVPGVYADCLWAICPNLGAAMSDFGSGFGNA
jgi:hypothetical protein